VTRGAQVCKLYQRLGASIEYFPVLTCLRLPASLRNLCPITSCWPPA